MDHDPGCALGLGGNMNWNVWYNGKIDTIDSYGSRNQDEMISYKVHHLPLILTC